MKLFHCHECDHLVFFENTSCVRCGTTLAYLPELGEMGTLLGDSDLWRSGRAESDTPGRHYRLCRNAADCLCNWAVPSGAADVFCFSCRLTRVVPDLRWAGNREAWTRLESAKRRLVANLIHLGLPVVGKHQDPDRGLAFEFLADSGPEQVLTGHDEGLITVNIAEADDAERERRRLQFHEPYRTLLGHFRHESGHHYWNVLIRDDGRVDAFREVFGDEREDYGAALGRHHAGGAPADWAESFVSTYASSHPWEDWAETWAHYLHIVDTLDTAVASGLTLNPARPDEPSLSPDIAVVGRRRSTFPAILDRWFPLTSVLNNLNRGMGLPDAYPFVLSSPAIRKLQFIHEVVEEARSPLGAPAACA